MFVNLSLNLDSWQLCTDGHPGEGAAFIPPLEDLTQLCHCMPLTRKCDKSETCVLVLNIVQTLCTYFYLVLLLLSVHKFSSSILMIFSQAV